MTELTTLDAFDCVRWVWRQEAQEQFFSDGPGAAVPADHYPEPWQSAPPGSAAEAVMNFICAWKPK